MAAVRRLREVQAGEAVWGQIKEGLGVCKKLRCYSVNSKSLWGILPDHFATAGEYSDSEKTPWDLG